MAVNLSSRADVAGSLSRTASLPAAVYELPVFTWETIWEPEAKAGKHTEAREQLAGFTFYF